MKNYCIILLFLLTDISFTGCQPKDDSHYLKELRKKCTNPDIIEIERKKDYVEIEYMCDGKLFELIIEKNSGATSTETEADPERITQVMMKKINKNYPGWTIDEYSQIIINDTVLYKVELVKDGIEQNAYFTLSGKLFKSSNFLASQKWNSQILKSNPLFGNFNYDLFKPALSVDLPDVLMEVSGIAIKDAENIYCIQDELGTIFQYNIKNEQIEEMYRFTDVGDFEDLAVDEKNFYALRSDGALFSFNLDEYPDNIKTAYLPIRCLNIEGLFYDKKNNSLLVANHDNAVNEEAGKKNICSYALGGKRNEISILLNITTVSINAWYRQNIPELKTMSINFSPSAIAIHPITNDYYILSATDRMIVICGKDKTINNIIPLPADIFYKPEGLAFYANGDMAISNEGAKNGLVKANILIFKYRK